jgi:hypothetical protein
MARWLGNSTPASSSGGPLFTTQSNRVKFLSLLILRSFIHANTENVFTMAYTSFLFLDDNLNLPAGAA